MVVGFAGVNLVQWVEHRVGLIAESCISHSAEVKMEAVQQELNFDSGPPGLWTHRWGRTQDQGGAVHFAARFVLEPVKERLLIHLPNCKRFDEVLWHFKCFLNIYLFDMTECTLGAVRLRHNPPQSLQWILQILISVQAFFCPPAYAPSPPGRERIRGTEGDSHFRLLDHIQVPTRDSDDSATPAEDGEIKQCNINKQL